MSLWGLRKTQHAFAAPSVLACSPAAAAPVTPPPPPPAAKPSTDPKDSSLVRRESRKDTPTPTTDDDLRYLGYTGRLGRIAAAVKNVRLIAYTSDVGESLRPVVPRWVVNSAYGVSFAYVGCDVYFHTEAEMTKGSSREVVARTAIETFTFQMIASIFVPSLLIHGAVHRVEHMAKNWTSKYKGWAPPLAGLALIPLLPVTIDEPLEFLVGGAFDYAWPHPDHAPGGAHGGHGGDAAPAAPAAPAAAPGKKQD